MTETPGVLDAGRRGDQIADTSNAHHLQIIACAGSGKTETISRRIAELVQEGARPDSIVAFTFTERAATELKERAARRVAERMGEAFLDRLSPMFVGTIHSYCFRLLQTHAPAYGNYDVLDDHRHAGLLSREYHRLGLSKLGSPKHWQPIRDFIRTADIIANELVPPALDGTEGSRNGRILLVASREIQDPEHTGRYTLKVYESEKAASGDSWKHTRITLKPLNPDFEPIVLTPESEDVVRTVAEWVEVLR